MPFILLDSLEAIDAERLADLIEYVADYPQFFVVALLPEDAQALDDYDRITDTRASIGSRPHLIARSNPRALLASHATTNPNYDNGYGTVVQVFPLRSRHIALRSIR